MKTSYDKNKIKILLLENISPLAIENFKHYGYTNIEVLPKALSQDELINKLSDVHILGIRSKTQINEKVLVNAPKLLSIGCFCIGTNQVNLQAATKQGVCVFNAPYSNTRSVAELTIGAMIMLIRQVFEKSMAMHQGNWNKETKNSRELRGKTVGIIGYGNIGTQVSILSEAMGAKVIYYDIEKKLPLGNATSMSTIEALLTTADILTIHIPHTAKTTQLINKDFLDKVKPGMLLINYSRGEVANTSAIAEALDNGTLSGAAIDVFEKEPEKNGIGFESILQGKPNVILTPHIGGSTIEAQEQIGTEVSQKIIDFIESGQSNGSKSIPSLNLPMQEGKHRILHIHNNVPGVLSSINGAMAHNQINIASQYLKTNDEVGYVVLDVDKEISGDAYNLLKDLSETIKVRRVF